MAGRESDPEKLRLQAQELLNKAKRLEERKFKVIGQLVYEYYKKDFAGFDEEKFKGEVRGIFSRKKEK